MGLLCGPGFVSRGICSTSVSIETGSPELGVFGAVDKDVAGAVAGQQDVADTDQDAEDPNVGGGKGKFLNKLVAIK